MQRPLTRCIPCFLRTSFLALVLFAPAIGSATTIVALPEAALSQRADAIVFGAVVDTRVEVNDRGQVSTVARFQIYQSVKGAGVGEVIELRVPGGRLPNGLVAEAYGSPKLVAGKMHFGFFEQRNGVYLPMGLSYGLLEARRDVAGVIHVWRDTGGLAMLTPTGGAVDPATTRLADVPLAQLVARSRGHLGRDATIGPEQFTGPGAVSP